MFRRMRISKLQHLGLMPVLLASLLMRAGLGGAAEREPVARYSIEQPAQDLSVSLLAIGDQTNSAVVFDPRGVQGRMAHAVTGRLSALEAVVVALQGTGLVAEPVRDGVIVVKPTPGSVPAALPPMPAASQAGSVDSGPNGGTGDPHRQSTQIAASPNEDAATASHDPRSNEPDVLTTVEITGSRLKRINDGPTPVNVYTSKDIEQSGQPNLERFLSSLNEASISPGEGASSYPLGQGTVQLRGLPVGTTLVLINGRRVEAAGSSSGDFFNINLIPTAAIERVEVVPVGSSAVYGGDALAGVINIILKKSLSAPSVTVRAGTGRGFSDEGLSVATGSSSPNGHYLLMGSYSHATPLTMAERGFFRDADYRRFGGADARGRNCTPGTVSSVSGGNLPGLTASFAGIPQLASGQTPQLSDFQASSGSANLCSTYANNEGYTLTFGRENFGVHAIGERDIAGSWVAFGELMLAKERTQSREIGLPLSSVRVPASNAFNPFGQDVMVTSILGPENGVRGTARQTRFTRALAGVRGDLVGDWEAELTLSTVRDNGGARTFDANVNTAARAAALAASSPAAALNPFTTGRAASDEVIRGIWSDSTRESHGRKDQIGALARGSLVDLPGGPVAAVVGVEGSDDHYDVVLPGQLAIHDGRRNSAVFGELRAPLWKGQGGGAPWDLAALSLAARRDHYSDFGSANTYQTGLELRPVRDVLVRASTASSFKPPTLVETNVDDIVYDASLFALTDPARGGEAVTSGTVVRTTNHDLQPERGRANGFGIVWQPAEHPGTRLGLTHWQVRIRGLISVLPAQTVLDHEALFPGFVTRGPSTNGQPGPLTSLKLAEVNYGSVDVAGMDLEAAYGWSGLLGRWNASIGATRTNEYKVVLAPGSAEDDRLGRRFTDFWAPRWKGRLSIGLERDAWSVAVSSRYLGHYLDAGTNPRSLGGYWLHDVAASVNLKKWWPDLGKGLGVQKASLSMSIANLGDREPAYVSTAPYFDVTQSDWRGRYFSVRASVDW